MRDGTKLATDLYLPCALPAPAVAIRTPYGRSTDAITQICLALAERGYVAISQDCRGTGDSEPDSWDYYVYEAEDGNDLVEWAAHQIWAACPASRFAPPRPFCIMPTILPASNYR